MRRYAWMAVLLVAALANVERTALSAAHVAHVLRVRRPSVHDKFALVIEIDEGLDIEGFARQVIDRDIDVGQARVQVIEAIGNQDTLPARFAESSSGQAWARRCARR